MKILCFGGDKKKEKVSLFAGNETQKRRKGKD